MISNYLRMKTWQLKAHNNKYAAYIEKTLTRLLKQKMEI
jgi:hypothetical protein